MDSILREQCRLDPARPVVVGVSGGPDSLCLMDLLRQAGYHILVAHFNHKLRDTSDAEADMVEKTAAGFNLPSIVESADVRAYAEEQKLSIEDAARALRYRFLFKLAREYQAQAVAVGHTADDQVETVLMHFLRGAGLNGLKGMAYCTVLHQFDAEIPVVRPLLDVWREETVVYCAGQGLHPHYDPSNDSPNFLRNRIRHLLIPTLETYNPKFREAVWRTAQSLMADHEILAQAVDLAWKAAVLSEANELVIFDSLVLAGFKPGMHHYLFRRAVEHIHPAADITYAMLERAGDFLQGHKGSGGLSLGGGVRLLKEGNQVFVAGEAAVLPFERWPQLPAEADVIPIVLPARVELPGDWLFTAEAWNIPALAREQMQNNEDPFQVWLDAETLKGQLSLRVRREGDRFEPLGMDGHTQKLSDFFTNEKLPLRARERWPLLCVDEKIAWVPGYQPAHVFRLTKESRRIIYFSLHPPETEKASEKAEE
jgi:tRNA(Ile)-lysidine synthase